MNTAQDRGFGALAGLAVGDALGMPTQSMSRQDITKRFGEISALVDGPADQPIAPSMPAGSITDDTEQALLVARLVLEGDGQVDPTHFAHELLSWEEQMRAKGSLDLLGPSTSAAVAAIVAGEDPNEAGKRGATNGAAMRIAPVGVATPTADAEVFLSRVRDLSFVTHNTGLGLSAATLIGAAVSAGIDGAEVDDAIACGLDLAAQAESLGHWIAGASVSCKTKHAIRAASHIRRGELADYLYGVIGTSVLAQESVVSAVIIASHFQDDPFSGLCFAASLGGDTDTMAAMAGAVLGATRGASAIPSEHLTQVENVSGIDLAPIANNLIALRGSVPVT